MKRPLAGVGLVGLVAIAALAAWLVGKRAATPEAETRSDDASPSATAPSALAPAPGMGPEERGRAAHPTASAPTPAGTSVCEIHVTTFGTPARDVEIRSVDAPTIEPPAAGVVRVNTRPGARIGVSLAGAAIPMVRVDIPAPVPSRIDVRVPAQDDPRLESPALLVVDEKTGKSLPDAVLDPGEKAPEEAPVHAGSDGTIRVPPVLAERIRANPALGEAGVVSERNHLPRDFASLSRWNYGTAADWAGWDVTGVMRVRLEPIDGDVPRRTLRIVDEDGRTKSGRLVLLRTPSMDILLMPGIPSRGDASGRIEVVAPQVAAYDVYDGAALVGTFVVARDTTPASEPREIRVPVAIRVHVIVRGVPSPRPVVVLRGPQVVALDADEKTGWARINGKVEPGWKAFERSTGTQIDVGDALPVETDVWLPRGRPVVFEVADREATLRADEPKTIEIDWTTLPPVRRTRSLDWSLTREGLDDSPFATPTMKTNPK